MKFFAITILTLSLALSQEAPKAIIDGKAPGWRDLSKADFMNVNCKPTTWIWKGNTVTCDGNPIGVIRSKTSLKNFELICEWKHLKPAGNSGIFAWVSPEAIAELEAGKGRLPAGIEVQILDLAYATQWIEKHGKAADWFTSHGDIFPTGNAKMQPFPPVAPNGKRSFPTKHLTKPVGQWNHYYIRAINGEIRLWVNGSEVSGGKNCQPAEGYLCLESEGTPIEFRNLRLRTLP